MTVTQVYTIRNNQLIIDIPDTFKGKEKLLVILDDHIDSKAEKLAMMQKAAHDPLFLADIQEVSDDFKAIDDEPS